MNKKYSEKILCDGFYEEARRELEALPSDEELRRDFPVTEEKRNSFIKLVYAKKKPAYITYLQRAAVFFLVFSAVTFGALLTNPEIRADMLEKGIKLFDEYIQFDFSEDKSDYTIDFDNIEIGYIPEGYELIYNDSSNTDIRNIYYNEKSDTSVTIDMLLNCDDIHLRITDSFEKYNSITINGFSGYTAYDSNNSCNLIIWGNSNFQICIIGEIQFEELKNIAFNIKY